MNLNKLFTFILETWLLLLLLGIGIVKIATTTVWPWWFTLLYIAIVLYTSFQMSTNLKHLVDNRKGFHQDIHISGEFVEKSDD